MIQLGSRFLVACLTATLCLGCSDLGEETSEDWAIYRLSDPTLTSYQVRDEPLSSLTLAPTPFISVGDIRSYDWETHAIEFTPEMDSLMDAFQFHGGPVQGIPFVVTVGRERIYLGSFWWAYSSMTPVCPFLELISPKPRRIGLPLLYEAVDPRRDMRIYWSLKKAGVLKED